MRLMFKCGLCPNAAYVQMWLMFKYKKLYDLKVDWALFAAAYIGEWLCSHKLSFKSVVEEFLAVQNQ